MGKRGPKPKRPNLRVLGGNAGKRPIPTGPMTLADVELPPGSPEPPAWLELDDAAADQWCRLAPVLIAKSVLTEVDHLSFGLLCSAWSYWQQAAREVDERGVVIEHANGCLGANPAVAIAKQWRECVITGAKEFGLTPATRGRVDISPGKGEPNRLERFLNKEPEPYSEFRKGGDD